MQRVYKENEWGNVSKRIITVNTRSLDADPAMLSTCRGGFSCAGVVCQRLGSSKLGSLRWTCSCHVERWPTKTSFHIWKFIRLLFEIKNYFLCESPFQILLTNLNLNLQLQAQTTKGHKFFKPINATSEISLVASKCENIIYYITCE